MQRLIPHPVLSLFLLTIWLLLNNTIAFGHILLGGTLAILIPFITAGFWPEEVPIQKPFAVFRFVIIVMWDIVVANFTVAKLILMPTRRLRPAFISMPLDIRSPLGISILANTISLTPGTVSCELTADHKVLLIHSLHVDDIDGSIKEMKQRYERPLMEILQSC